MMARRLNSRGQSVFFEYVTVIFIVVAALTAITVYARRALQARIHAAHTYMIDAVNKACDANCQNATGQVGHEYEPYYTQTSVITAQNVVSASTAEKAKKGQEGLYRQMMNASTETHYQGGQLPAQCAGDYGPPCCYTVPPSC